LRRKRINDATYHGCGNITVEAVCELEEPEERGRKGEDDSVGIEEKGRERATLHQY